MKIFYFVFLPIFFTSYASAATKCDSEVLKIAQLNMDYLAKSIQQNGAQVSKPTLLLTQKVDTRAELNYHLDGMIYKGPYDVLVTVDNECKLISVALHAIAD
jgi:hypothetical protein